MNLPPCSQKEREWRDANPCSHNEYIEKIEAELAEVKAERDDYAQRWHELAAKQPDIDAVLARLTDAEAERDRLNLAVDRLARKAAIYCPRDECCDKFQSDGSRACAPCMRDWALAELPGAKETPSPHQRDELPRRGD